MLAFGKDATDVHFATSSATFANNADIQDPIIRKQKEDDAEYKLKKFISDLTGTSISQVKIIDGVREGEELLTADCQLPQEDKNRCKRRPNAVGRSNNNHRYEVQDSHCHEIRAISLERQKHWPHHGKRSDTAE
jgi:hypothetical protein